MHSYGIHYQNSFEKKNQIVAFEDVLHHLETVYYSERRRDPKKGPVRSVPLWKPNIFKWSEFTDISSIVKKTPLKLPPAQGLFDRNWTFVNHLGFDVYFIGKKGFWEKFEKHFAKTIESGEVTDMARMTLLNRSVFEENPEFRIDYIVNNIDCDNKFFVTSNDYCMVSFAFRDIDNRKSDLGQRTEYFDRQVQNFLGDRLNQRVVYRSVERDRHLLETEGNRLLMSLAKGQEGLTGIPSRRRRRSSRLEQRFSASPVVIGKQINLIEPMGDDFFVVLTKKTFLGVYDKKNKVFFYVYEIKEDQFHAQISVYNERLFSVELKRSLDDNEYFKIMVFYFEVHSMTVQLVNKQLQMIRYIHKHVMHSDEFLYLFTLKTDFLGVVVFKFNFHAVAKDEVLGVSRFNIKREMKQVVELEDYFENATVIENYRRKLKSAKIGCELNLKTGIMCVVQFESLDNLFLNFKIVKFIDIRRVIDVKETPNQTEKAENAADPPSADERQSRLFGRILGKCVPRHKEEPKKEKHPLAKIKVIKKHKKPRHQRKRQFKKKIEGAQGQSRNDDLGMLNSIAPSIVSLRSIKLIKNPNNSKLVSETQIYFYKSFLILVYQLKSVLRLYFYTVKDLHSEDSLLNPKPETLETLDLTSQSKRASFVDLFYRLELNLLKSTFLELQFSEDAQQVDQKTDAQFLLETFEIVGILRVVFNNRIETFKISPKIKIFIKNRKLDFAKLQVFARNHLQTKEGRANSQWMSAVWSTSFRTRSCGVLSICFFWGLCSRLSGSLCI